MAIPMNQQDYRRFKKLAEICSKTSKAEISTYISETGKYVSLEIKAHDVDPSEIKKALGINDPGPEAVETAVEGEQLAEAADNLN